MLFTLASLGCFDALDEETRKFVWDATAKSAKWIWASLASFSGIVESITAADEKQSLITPDGTLQPFPVLSGTVDWNLPAGAVFNTR